MQGFNMGRYVPPEHEGTASANQLAGKHALGSRARSAASAGILTVRFEMPFPIWCTGCPRPAIIGQGVRFNAEKRRVGSYHSTPVLGFRMKHADCGGWIEIRTDPKNTAYVVHAGARRRDTGEDRLPADGGGGGAAAAFPAIMTAEEREARRANAFAALEGKVEDGRRLAAGRQRLEQVQELQDRMWEDPYERSRTLRRGFRAERKARERDAGAAEALRDRMSLGVRLLPESEDDARRAALVDFGGVAPERAMRMAVSRPLFAAAETSTTTTTTTTTMAKTKKTTSGVGQAGNTVAGPGRERSKRKQSREEKSAALQAQKRAELVNEIRGSTRAKLDPFLSFGRAADDGSGRGRIMSGIKRKRDTTDAVAVADKLKDLDASEMRSTNRSLTEALVDYESD